MGVAISSRANIVQISLPRKGTETTNSEANKSPSPKVQISLPRKGTETFEVRFEPPDAQQVQISLPRKGTETMGNQKAEGGRMKRPGFIAYSSEKHKSWLLTDFPFCLLPSSFCL